MQPEPTGNALVYCQNAYGTTYGKTAHGLVRRSRRFRVVAVIDTRHAGKDAGQVLDGRENGIPILSTMAQAMETGANKALQLTHFVFAIAPDGGRLAPEHREPIKWALAHGLHVVAGLHDFLSDDLELQSLAQKNGVTIHDVRRPPPRDSMHMFTGDIQQVNAFRIAVLGTDSAVGKRTTAWIMIDALQSKGIKAELIGTGQTAWLQGVRYGIVLDSLVNDFVAGEIEHAVCTAWREQRPDAILLEGQGSLLHPAYPGGFEILAAGRPDAVILQHAATRREYDGFPGWTIHPLDKQIRAIELVSDKPVVAIALNTEGLSPEEVDPSCARLTAETGLPAFNPLGDQGAGLADLLMDRIRTRSPA